MSAVGTAWRSGSQLWLAFPTALRLLLLGDRPAYCPR